MNPDSIYAFYGSLRQGMSNHRRFERGMTHLFTEKLPGFVLYAKRFYPYAVKSTNPHDTIVAEVYQVKNPRTERAIHELELSVGYYYDEVLIRGHRAGIYLFEKPGPEPLVKDGDWVKFFCS